MVINSTNIYREHLFVHGLPKHGKEMNKYSAPLPHRFHTVLPHSSEILHNGVEGVVSDKGR